MSGAQRPSLRFGAALGVLAGVAYAASPITVWFLLAMAGIFAWAGRGLGARERRWLWTVLALAVGIRALAIAGLFSTMPSFIPSSFFWDGDGVYLKYRALVIRNVWSGYDTSAADFATAFSRQYGWTSYLYVLAYLQYLTAVSPAGVHLLNVTLFVASGVMLYRMARESFGRAPAMLGLTLMMFLPTLMAWSMAALKESFYIFLFVIGLRAAVGVVRGPGIRWRLLALAALVAAVAANSTVRVGASLIMTVGLGLGLASALIARRWVLVALAIVLVPIGVHRLWLRPDVEAQVMTQLRNSATIHLGNVRTVGNFYRVLDQRFYSDEWRQVGTMQPVEGLRFVVRAVASFVAVPLPWQIISRVEVLFLGQQVLWYLLVAFAVVGLVRGLRTDPLVTCLLASLTVAGALTIALNSGNIGTMVRFRDTIVPFLVWLSAHGITTTLADCVSRKSVVSSLTSDRGSSAMTDVEAAST